MRIDDHDQCSSALTTGERAQALNEDDGKLAIYKRYGGVEPSENPAYDAPLSFVVDTLFLPMDALYLAQAKVGLGRPSWLQMLADLNLVRRH